MPDTNDNFTKGLIERFISSSEGQIKEIQELKLKLERLHSIIDSKPYFEDAVNEFIQDLMKRYTKQKDDCKQCVIGEQARQIIEKDKLISFLIKTTVGLVTLLIGAGVYSIIKP